MKDEAILKALSNANFINTDVPTTEALTCQEECEAKLAIAIAACNLLPDPLSKITCMKFAHDAFDRCSDHCE
ncbi:hypothetical protein ACT7C7_08940 [Bacillus cereus]